MIKNHTEVYLMDENKYQVIDPTDDSYKLTAADLKKEKKMANDNHLSLRSML